MKTLTVIIAAAVLMVMTTPSFAYPRPVEKLKDGLTAVVTSPLEIKDHAMAEAKDGSFLPLSLPSGMLKGTFYMGKKLVGGALDVATFPIHN
jgi:hypothetical protein